MFKNISNKYCYLFVFISFLSACSHESSDNKCGESKPPDKAGPETVSQDGKQLKNLEQKIEIVNIAELDVDPVSGKKKVSVYIRYLLMGTEFGTIRAIMLDGEKTESQHHKIITEGAGDMSLILEYDGALEGKDIIAVLNRDEQESSVTIDKRHY